MNAPEKKPIYLNGKLVPEGGFMNALKEIVKKKQEHGQRTSKGIAAAKNSGKVDSLA